MHDSGCGHVACGDKLLGLRKGEIAMMAVKILYWLAAAGWIVHLGYWIIIRRKYKKGMLSGDDLFKGLFSDYTIATLALIMLCLLGTYGIYLGKM